MEEGDLWGWIGCRGMDLVGWEILWFYLGGFGLSSLERVGRVSYKSNDSNYSNKLLDLWKWMVTKGLKNERVG